MGRKRRSYDRDFKFEAVRLITERGKKATEVAGDLGIHVNFLYFWKPESTGRAVRPMAVRA